MGQQPKPDVYALHDGGLRVTHELDEALTVMVGPGAKIAAIVGEPFELELAVLASKPEFAIVRAPAAGSYLFETPRFLASTPGLYLLHISLGGGWSRTVPIVMFPPAALDRVGFGRVPAIGPDGDALNRRCRLRSIVQDPRATFERIATCLDAPGDPCLGLAGAIIGEQTLNVQNYGGFPA